MAKYLHFENAFLNGKLESTVYAELPRYMFSENKRNTNVVRLKRSLYGLNDTARIGNKFLFQKL